MRLFGNQAAGIAVLFLAACEAPRAAPAPDTEFLNDLEIAPELADYEFSDPRAWAVNDADGVASIELVGASDYEPPFRSPRSVALLRGYEFGDFELDLRALQTGREYGHRDLCLVFGFESPSRYYYVHLATAPDENAHNVFLVDGAARRPLLEVQAEGVDWGTDAWHSLRLERSLDDGLIAVWFDDLVEPVLVVRDTTLGRGQIGFGSFDDTGRFAEVRVTAPAVRSIPQGSQAFPSR